MAFLKKILFFILPFATILRFNSADIKFDHSNCMEMKPQISRSKPQGSSFVLAYAKIYSVYISSSSFKSGSPIRIAVNSCKSANGMIHGMKAFLLQARGLDSKFLPIGHFNTTSLPSDAQAISCYYPYDSVINKLDKNVKELSAYWIPPRDFRGSIAFYLTVIPHGTHSYYLRVKSPPLHPGNGTSVALHEKCPSKAAFIGTSCGLLLFLASLVQMFLVTGV